MSDKNISMASYQWGHFGAIMADVIVFGVIAFFAYRSRISIINSSGNSLRKTTLLFNLNVIFWLSIIVAFITLLGLIPVFKDYDRIIIS
jgi:hypothetical protein